MQGPVHQLTFGADEVVFVATEGVSAEVIDGVVVDGAVFVEPELLHGRNDEPLSGAVVGNEVFEALALGGGVFEVGADGVDIESSAVEEETAALGGFEDVVAGVVIDEADFAVVEQVVFDLFDHLFGLAEVFVRDEAPELGFNPKDSLIHGFTLRNKTCPLSMM